MKLSNLKIGLRLALAFAVLIALLLLNLGAGISVLNRVSATMDGVVDDRYAQIALSNQIKNVGDKGVITIGRILLSTDPAQLKKYMDEYAAIRALNTENFARFEKLLHTDESKRLFEEQTAAKQGCEQVGLLRLEQFYPFPADTLGRLLARYEGLRELVWVQEEHLNQGARQFVREALEALEPLLPQTTGPALQVVARPASASGATSSVLIHRREQAALVARALGLRA